MKIIEEREPVKPGEFRAYCKGCASLVEGDWTDIRHRHESMGNMASGSSRTVTTFVCPVCEEVNDAPVSSMLKHSHVL